MTREEAISILTAPTVQDVDAVRQAVDFAVGVLKGEGTASDTVSRKRVLEVLTDIFYNICKTEDAGEAVRIAKTAVSVMSSTQPEIVRCRDCKHYKHCMINSTTLYFCDLHYPYNFDIADDDFCSRAERRTDG